MGFFPFLLNELYYSPIDWASSSLFKSQAAPPWAATKVCISLSTLNSTKHEPAFWQGLVGRHQVDDRSEGRFAVSVSVIDQHCSSGITCSSVASLHVQTN